MSKKKYLIACLDEADKIHEMKEMYLVIVGQFFSRGNFKLDKQLSVIQNGSLFFYFKTPAEIQCIDDQRFNSVAESKNFKEFASFDSKTGFKFIQGKLGKNGKQSILQKLSESRKQSSR